MLNECIFYLLQIMYAMTGFKLKAYINIKCFLVYFQRIHHRISSFRRVSGAHGEAHLAHGENFAVGG